MTDESLVKAKKTQVNLIEYDESSFRDEVFETLDVFKSLGRPSKVRWIRVIGLEDEEMIRRLAENFGVHQLTLEDILNLDQRAKIEEFDDYTYVTLRIFHYDSRRGEISSEQLSIVIYQNSIITFERRKSRLLNDIEDQIRFSRGIVRKMGADYLLYLIMDSTVDSYFYLLEKIEESIQMLEDELTSNPTSKTLQSIHALKRSILRLQKNLWPLREVVGKLEKARYEFITDKAAPFFRDLYDHVVTAIENVDMLHVMLSDMLDIYFSAVSTRLNEIMKMLTMIATIFMPLTFIAGIYGMNFRYMPELELPWGYPATLLVMLGIGLIMFAYFKRKKWIL